jgi:hypothetical protein
MLITIFAENSHLGYAPKAVIPPEIIPIAGGNSVNGLRNFRYIDIPDKCFIILIVLTRKYPSPGAFLTRERELSIPCCRDA